jgi:hypothetical protein
LWSTCYFFMFCTQLSISLWELLMSDRSGVPVLQMDPDPAFRFVADPDPDPNTYFFPYLDLQCSKMTFYGMYF